MGQKLRLLEKYGDNSGNIDGCFLTLDLDRLDDHIVEPFLVLFNQYWREVNEEDLSGLQVYQVNGNDVLVPEIQATLYMLMQEGAKIKLAYEGSDLIGFLVYHTVYKSVVVIRHLYSIRERSSTAKRLVESALPNVKKLLFQTRKRNPPNRLLSILRNADILHEDNKLIDWEMQWQCH